MRYDISFIAFFIFAIILLLNNRFVQCKKHKQNHGNFKRFIVPKSRGEPFPKPQYYVTSDTQHYLDGRGFSFSFAQNSQICEVLSIAFNRYYKIIFQPHNYEIIENKSLVKKRRRPKTEHFDKLKKSLLESVFVNVHEPCEDYPSLESDESCKFTLNCLQSIFFYKERF